MQICSLKPSLLIVEFPWSRSRLYATLESENQKLRAELDTSNAEIHRLKGQLVQQQLANNARVDRVQDILASASTKPGQPSH